MTPALARLRELETVHRGLVGDGPSPFRVVIERLISATEAIVNGRPTILAGTNNYLGLTFDPACIEAACVATREQGTGTTGSRLANGTFAGHVRLERTLAEFFGRRAAIVFSTGYLANVGMLSTLLGPGEVVLIDADCHASIYDGCRLGQADIIRVRHNNVADLEKRLRRLGDRAAGALIVVEGIYSMLGDLAPLADIVAVKRAFGALLLVDEAHSFGVLGPHGRGLAEELGVEDSVDFTVGTFSKSLGATGGFCVSDDAEFDLVRYAMRPYVFTASPSPSAVASATAALEAISTRSELRERLWRNANRLHRRLSDDGFRLAADAGPIVAILMPDAERGVAFWTELLARGVYVNLMLPPATPNGSCLLRCSVSAAHSAEQIERVADAFQALAPTLAGAAARDGGDPIART
jgi:8-amino-7-oxononanoate synthase